MNNSIETSVRAIVIVAHPDDEILWCGGLILSHPEWQWTVLSLCRGNDPDRQQRFFRSMERLGAVGKADSLDDGPEQYPLRQEELKNTIRCHLGDADFDLVLTHGPQGEYTRHLRHEEVSKAVSALWAEQQIRAKEIRLFAYSDDARRHLPVAIKNAHLVTQLSDELWAAKRDVMKTIYGFGEDSWEYLSTLKSEAFWCFQNAAEIEAWSGGGKTS